MKYTGSYGRFNDLVEADASHVLLYNDRYRFFN